MDPDLADIELAISIDEREEFLKGRELEKNRINCELQEKVKNLKQSKDVEIENKFLEIQKESIESFSGIILKSERNTSENEMKSIYRKREYIDFSEMEYEVLKEKPMKNDYFTVAILAQTSEIKKSKNGKNYIRWTMTNLQKIDTKRQLEVIKENRNQENSLRNIPSSFLPSAPKLPSQVNPIKTKSPNKDPAKINGYHILNILLFESSVKEFYNEHTGGVFAFSNPVPMGASDMYGYTLAIQNSTQILKIGNSHNFDYCSHSLTKSGYNCRNFVNTSIERRCEMHTEADVKHIRAKRGALRTEAIHITPNNTNSYSRSRGFTLSPQRQGYLIDNNFRNGVQEAIKIQNDRQPITPEEREKDKKIKMEEAERLKSFIHKRKNIVPNTQNNQQFFMEFKQWKGKNK